MSLRPRAGFLGRSLACSAYKNSWPLASALAIKKQSTCPVLAVNYDLPIPGMDLLFSSTMKAGGSGGTDTDKPAFTVYEVGEIDEQGRPLGPAEALPELFKKAEALATQLTQRIPCGAMRPVTEGTVAIRNTVITPTEASPEAATKGNHNSSSSKAPKDGGPRLQKRPCPPAPRKQGGAHKRLDNLAELQKTIGEILRARVPPNELSKMKLESRPKRRLAAANGKKPFRKPLRERLIPPRRRIRTQEPEPEVVWAESLPKLREICWNSVKVSKERIANIHEDVFRFEKKWVALFDQLDALVCANEEAVRKLGRQMDTMSKNMDKLLKVVRSVAVRDTAVASPKLKRARGAKSRKRKPEKRRRLILWEIFSGTGSLSRTFREEFGWEVYQIDSSRDLARKTGAVCADVRNFDFSSWPQPDLIFFAPPCIGWSNATKKSVRDSPAMDDMTQGSGALVSRIGGTRETGSVGPREPSSYGVGQARLHARSGQDTLGVL